MDFPPSPKTPYILNKEQDQRIFAKLEKFREKKLSREQEMLVRFFYAQLETDWRTPLEEAVDKLLSET